MVVLQDKTLSDDSPSYSLQKALYLALLRLMDYRDPVTLIWAWNQVGFSIHQAVSELQSMNSYQNYRPLRLFFFLIPFFFFFYFVC